MSRRGTGPPRLRHPPLSARPVPRGACFSWARRCRVAAAWISGFSRGVWAGR